MKIEQKIQNILDRNFTRGDNAKALKELLILYDVSNRRELLIAFSDWIMNNEDSPNYVTHFDIDEYLSNL